MTLPVFSSPLAMYSGQSMTLLDGIAPTETASTAPTEDMVLPSADRIAATLDQKTGVMTEQQHLKRLQEIRARAKNDGWIDPPVPVTEILLLDLNKAPNDAIAGQNAKALYEGLQNIFATNAPGTPRTAPDRAVAQAA